jgi:CHAT domain-containing protein
LSSPGDVLVDSIQAYGGGQGGHVGIQGDRIQITGRVIPPDGSLTPPPISIRAGESVTIAHQGGKTNQPFMIGNPSVNGSAGGIQVGAAVLPQGSFPIQPQTVEYQPIDSVRIIAENDPPRFTAQAIQFLLRPGQRTDFTLEQLGVKAPADRNQDQVTILLRPNADFLAAGGQLLNANGLPLSADRPIQLSDRLTYIAPRQNAGVFDAFEIIAIDHVSFAGGSSAQRIPLRFDNVGLIPQAEPAAPKPAAPAPAAPSGSSISNISAGELAAMDSQLSQDFQSAGIQNGATNSDPNTLTRQMERQTGIRSALVYLRLLKTPSGHELSITLATAKGRFQKRVMVNATELNDTIAQFRREVTNPLKTHTKSYLPAAKQLYRWMIAPIYEDLQAQGVTNLVFLPEAGLRSLPYGALHSGRQFLIEQFSLGLMPSVGLTQTSYQQIQQANLLAVGVSESTQGQAALPMVKTELAMIAQLWAKQTAYLNQAATVDQLRQARQRHPFEIVHLATHANFQAGAPKDAYIQLWNQQLKLEQIRGFNWHNPPVELLVLSACRTAIGDRESELGFAGLAVQTGVKTAVASLWYVNDTATTALISKFYQTLRSSRVKVEALRQAQLAMMRGDVTITEGKITGLSTPIALPEDLQVSDPNFRHPYYWAAFTMVGSPW